jgi:hypothetical protein
MSFRINNKTPVHHLTSLQGFTPIPLNMMHPEITELIKPYHKGNFIMAKFELSSLTIFCNHITPNMWIVIEET